MANSDRVYWSCSRSCFTSTQRGVNAPRCANGELRVRNGMMIQLPKQDCATVKVAFQCGISIRFVLEYYSDTNQYDLRIAWNPDNEKSSYRMKYLHDMYEEDRKWDVFYDECYHTDAHGHWYNVIAYVAENDDSYDIRVKLHEITVHEA